MPTVRDPAMSRVHWIDRPEQLAALAARLRDAPVIALDTEQDSFFAYRTKVCVAQIGAVGEEWIVDTLALPDLRPLAEVLSDPAVPKILHAADNDIDLLRRRCDVRIRGLFDTMVASSIVGYRRTGLAGLLEEHFGVKVEKRFQRSDWRQRPLSREQIEYAALDVRHLAELRELLLKRLEELGRLEEAHCEFERLERVEREEKTFDPDDCLRMRGVEQLDGVGRRILRELVVLREEIAADEDRAVFRVCPDGPLLAMAARPPRSPEELAAVRGLPDRLRNRLGRKLLASIRAAYEAGPLPRPPRRGGRGAEPGARLDDDQKALFDRLRDWRGRRAETRDVEPGRVIPNSLLLKVVEHRPRDAAGLRAAGLEEWRVREYGDDILALLRDAAEG